MIGLYGASSPPFSQYMQKSKILLESHPIEPAVVSPCRNKVQKGLRLRLAIQSLMQASVTYQIGRRFRRPPNRSRAG